MASKLFGKTVPGQTLKPTDTVNSAGGAAYAYTKTHKLAQIVCTGFFSDTFYATAKDQLDQVTALALDKDIPDETIAKIAVYARQKGYMKDMPAVLGVALSVRNPALWAKIFDRVADDVRMIRNVVQISRSGKLGRKSLGANNRKLIGNWVRRQSGDQLFRQSVGNDPSLAQVIKLAHPHPGDDKERNAVIRMLLEHEVDEVDLPAIVKDYRAYRKDPSLPQPNVPIEMIQDVMDKKGWVEFAKRASLRATLTNLTKFAANGVFDDPEASSAVCARLRDKDLIVKNKILPYKIMQAYMAAEQSRSLKGSVLNALHDCMELSVENIPSINGQVYVGVDVSGSMGYNVIASPAGSHGNFARVRCVDVAGLIAAGILRKNPDSVILPFDQQNHTTNNIRARDSVVTIAQNVAAYGGGGTNCELPLRHLNAIKANGDTVVYVSDNESWITRGYSGNATGLMTEWRIYKHRNPKARLVLIDLTPGYASQATLEADILQVGGWSDEVFNVIANFAKAGKASDFWLDEIEKIEI